MGEKKGEREEIKEGREERREGEINGGRKKMDFHY